MTVYLALADGRECEDLILGVYAKEDDAKKCVGKYHREKNSEEDMFIEGLHDKPISDMTDLELADTPLSQFSCIIGCVEEFHVN